MLKLRLQRRGKKNYATYRVVVAEDRAPIQGRYIADVGHYNPHTDTFAVKKEEVAEWIGKGVQPTPTVNNLLVAHKMIEGEKVTSWRPKKKADEADGGDTEAQSEEAGGKEEKAENNEAEAAPEETAADQNEEASGKEEKQE